MSVAPLKSINPFVGAYALANLTITFLNGSMSQPLGTEPYGRLVLTPNLYFISQFNAGNYVSDSFRPFPQLYVPGSDTDNAAVVRNSLGLSGTYRVENGQYMGLTTTGSTIPNYINSSVVPPNSTFTFQGGNQTLIETLTSSGDGSVVEYHWQRTD